MTHCRNEALNLHGFMAHYFFFKSLFFIKKKKKVQLQPDPKVLSENRPKKENKARSLKIPKNA